MFLKWVAKAYGGDYKYRLVGGSSVLMDYKINTPIWATRSVGIDESKLDPDNTVEILYTNQASKRIYPKTYHIKKEKALLYPLQVWRGIKLRIIPIGKLEEA